MRSLFRSRTLPCRAARFALLAAFGWGLVAATGTPLWAVDVTRGLQERWDTDFSRHTVPMETIVSGGPGKDGIPAIDAPRFIGFGRADEWLHPKEPVIAVEVNGDARAYPLQVLLWHEIVNDRVGGLPVAVTFCPLCNAALAFDRGVEGRVLDFGTTGRLRKSDLVMYDRQTESWWQQFTGRGIVGHFAGTELRKVDSRIVAYADFKEAFPDGEVLSRDTGYDRPYGRNPYRGYDRISDKPFLLQGSPDPRLPAMARVLGVERGDAIRVYPLSVLEERPVINDDVGDRPIVVLGRKGMLSALDAERIAESREVAAAAAYLRRHDGRVLTFERRDGKVMDRQTGSEWDLFGRAVAGPLKGTRLEAADGGVHFAFAWLAFHPETEVYGK
ncbi:MAG TPA: DUF3179 domain-containing protein [Gammaproteobacteria bacterium]|nr:DUF3179 domain-containing protein [Gammaproteobacteria bacterium]